MAAAIATIHALRDEAAIEAMGKAGALLRAGLDRQSRAHGVAINQTGPVQMPNVSFDGDVEFAKAMLFCATAMEHGAILHPRHNWFLCAAHTDADIERVLVATDAGFRAVRERYDGV
jgi:glutamate-1-semialdehyde 2,1-aminomutase